MAGIRDFDDPYADRLRRRQLGQKVSRLPVLMLAAVRTVRAAQPGFALWTFVAALVVAATTTLQVVFTREILKVVLEEAHPLRSAVPAVAGLATCLLVQRSVTAIQTEQLAVVRERVLLRSWDRVFNVASKLKIEAYDDPEFYSHLQRVRMFALSQPVTALQGLAGLASGAIAATMLAVTLAFLEPLVLPVLLLGAVPVFLLRRRASQIEHEFALEGSLNVRERFGLTEALTGRAEAKEVRAFGVGALLHSRFDALYDAYVNRIRRKAMRKERLALMAGAISVVTALASIVIIIDLADGRDGLAAGGAVLAAAVLLAARLDEAGKGAAALYESGLYLDDLQAFYALDSADVASRAPGVPIDPEVIELRDVSYRYPQASSNTLSSIDLVIRRGQLVALVGENGSGKTTLSKILAHTYTPDSGTLLWDGVDVTTINLADLRASTAVLFQDFVHYELSLRDNVGLGHHEKVDDQPSIDAAAEAAGLRPLVENLPRGFETLLSPRLPGGIDLSGGEWQRVGMARALLRDAPFVVLDEPATALDPIAEASLYADLLKLLHGRTAVIVSHRLAAVRHADLIVVMRDGRIAERGTHDQLMADAPYYRALFAQGR